MDFDEGEWCIVAETAEEAKLLQMKLTLKVQAVNDSTLPSVCYTVFIPALTLP